MCIDIWYKSFDWKKREFHLREQLKNNSAFWSKANYLKMQASYLMDSPNKKDKEEGASLMKRLLSQNSEGPCSLTGHEELGDYYLENENFQEAENHYRTVTQTYHSSTRKGTTGTADLKLSETILRSNQEGKFQEAFEIATTKFSKTGGTLPFNDQKFYYNNLLANLCDRMGKFKEASKYASKALELSKITQPQFVRYKSLGQIKTNFKSIETLKKIRQNF